MEKKYCTFFSQRLCSLLDCVTVFKLLDLSVLSFLICTKEAIEPASLGFLQD